MLYHNYIFLGPKESLFNIENDILAKYKKEFIKKIEKEKKVITYTYATVGLTGNSFIMLWLQSESLNTIQDFINDLLHSSLGKHIKLTGTLFGIIRPSQYANHTISATLNTQRTGTEYLIIYPFTKTTDWYMLPFEERKKLMQGHIAIGIQYPQIKQLLLYSFVLDDSEFIVSYETDSLNEFQTLVMELRSDPGRKYTLKDTPIFTCIYKPLEKITDYL